jgi:hypothetical protein
MFFHLLLSPIYIRADSHAGQLVAAKCPVTDGGIRRPISNTFFTDNPYNKHFPGSEKTTG